MWKSIKLVLIYYAAQLVASFALLAVAGKLFPTASYGEVTTWALLLSIAIMALVLWRLGYLNGRKTLWRVGSAKNMGCTVLMGLAVIMLSDLLTMAFSFMPDLMDDSFSAIESSVLGVVTIVVFGPVLEELLFRGAVTKELLARYPASKAILYSALIFGIFHLNPAQILPAFLVGLLLAWLYWKSRSLVPSLTVHILNNGLSVLLAQAYPDADRLIDVMGTPLYIMFQLLAVIALIEGIRRFSWKQPEV